MRIDNVMEPVLIPCPRCGRELKLRDRGLLGRIGKCPQCGHRFLLQEPEEVELELADEAVAATPAEWVPDEAAAPTSVAAAPAAGVIQVAAELESESPGARRLREIESKRARQRKWLLFGGGAVGAATAAIVAVVIALGSPAGRSPRERTAKEPPPSRNEAYEIDRQRAEDNLLLAEASKPPAGGPIKLQYIPVGANVVIHLRPAEIWKPGTPADDVRVALGPVAAWAERRIRELCLFEPSEIEEALICLYVDPGLPPRTALSVKLVEERPPAVFREKFRGTPNQTDYGRKVYIGEEFAWMITDAKGRSFAACPGDETSIHEMVRAVGRPGLPSGSIQELLDRSDDRRHLTIIFEPKDAPFLKRQLFAAETEPLLEQLFIRLEDANVETALVSFYFGDEKYDRFFSEILVRNRTSSEDTGLTANMVRKHLQRKLQSLPEELLAAIRYMDPQQIGRRRLIGRLPAMVRAFEVQTVAAVGGPGERWAQFTTVLPRVAGPNIAAASWMAWQEALRTDFSTEPASAGPKKKLPPTVAGRLMLPVEIDFRGHPLQEALDYIAESVSIRVEIDGDALKDAGYTKNMKQAFKLGAVPAKQAVAKIIGQYKDKANPGNDMVAVIDEPNMTLVVTTRKFALKNGQEPAELE